LRRRRRALLRRLGRARRAENERWRSERSNETYSMYSSIYRGLFVSMDSVDESVVYERLRRTMRFSLSLIVVDSDIRHSHNLALCACTCVMLSVCRAFVRISIDFYAPS